MNENINSSNVTPISKPSEETILLCQLLESIETWRANKKIKSEKMPAEIWDKVFVLLEIMPEQRVLASLGITTMQLTAKRHARRLITSHQSSIEKKQEIGAELTSLDVPDFCEAKPAFPLDYKPAKAFSTSTCVVELYRPDGMLMKIHICTDKFEDLLGAFFSGDTTC